VKPLTVPAVADAVVEPLLPAAQAMVTLIATMTWPAWSNWVLVFVVQFASIEPWLFESTDGLFVTSWKSSN
jgi:hypothetical protein